MCIRDSAYTAFKRGDAGIVAVLQHAPTIIICTTVLGELLAGFAAGQRESVNRGELTRFINVPRVKVVPGTAATADLYALIYAALRRKGRPIPTNDLWIAATALAHRMPVVTRNVEHFRRVPHLEVETY